ncbi:MAG: hypothetical protein Q4D38_12380 [Planctomycetia bacterium]|nr:hypothetical protein [Planctomycetia bacterium]
MKLSCIWIIRAIFVAYWIFLTILLLVWNPFAIVPIDEELVEKGFGLYLDAHVLTFLILSVLMLSSRLRRWWGWFVVLILYAGATEYLQGYTGRCPDWIDFGKNVEGLLYGLMGWGVCRFFHRKMRGRSETRSIEAQGAKE